MSIEMKIRGKFPIEIPSFDSNDFPIQLPTSYPTGLDIVRTGFDNFNHWDLNLICQEKLDGWFGVVIKEKDKCRWLKGWKEYSELQEPLEYFEKFMDNNSIAICEVMYGTPYGTKLKNKLGYVKCFVYDILKWNNYNLTHFPYLLRFSALRNHFENFGKDFPIQLSKYKILFNEYGNLPNYKKELDYRKEQAWKFFKEIVEDGGEGIIIKDCNSLYYPGKITNSMWKVKKYIIKSYVVMGFEISDAETYINNDMTISSIRAGLFVNGELKEVTRTSGFNFKYRKEFSNNPHNYIGKVIDIGGNELFKTGAIRHSNFLWFRPDKKIEECTL